MPDPDTNLAGFAQAAEAAKTSTAPVDPNIQSSASENPLQKAVQADASRSKVEVKPKPGAALQKPTDKPKEAPKAEGPNGDGKKPTATNGAATTQSDAQREAWKQIKAEAKQYKEIAPKYEALSKELETLRNTLKEFETQKGEWEKDRTEAKTIRQALDLKMDPEYQAAVTQPLEKQESEVSGFCELHKLNAEVIWDILSNPNRRERNYNLHVALQGGDDSQFLEGELREFGNAIEDLYQKDTEWQSNSEGLRNQIEASRTAKTEAQRHAQAVEMAKAEEETIATLQASIPELFESKDPEVVKRMEAMKSAKFLDNPMERALAAKLPFIVEALTGQLRLREAKIKELNETITDISGARPGGGGSPPAVQSSGGIEKDAAKALAQAANAMRGR